MFSDVFCIFSRVISCRRCAAAQFVRVFLCLICIYTRTQLFLPQAGFAQDAGAFSASDSDLITISIPETALGEDRVLTLSYNYAPQLIAAHGDDPLRAANIFFITIQTSATAHHYSVIMQNGQHNIYFYPFMFNGVIKSLIIEAPPELRELYGSIKQALGIQTAVQNIKDVQDASGGALPASVDDIIRWKGTHYTKFGTTRMEGDVRCDGDVFRWSAYPQFAVFVFVSDEMQERYLQRIAFFVEKKGARMLLLSDKELGSRKGWGAHDYKPDDLALFFETARLQQAQLNPEEYEFKRRLIMLGILQAVHEIEALPNAHNADVASLAVQAGTGTVSSISRSYAAPLQKILLKHELMHGWFFTDEKLRNEVQTVWDESSAEFKNLWQAFMAGMGYDDTFEYLVHNEFFAYLLQRPIESLQTYVLVWFGHSFTPAEQTELAKQITISARRLEDYIRNTYAAQAGFVEYLVPF